MRNLKILFLPLILFSQITLAYDLSQPKSALQPNPYTATISNIPVDIRAKMQNTWHPGCPVPLKDLRYLQVSFWGFDHKIHKAALIIHKELSHEVSQIFKVLYKQQFPIASIQLLDDFNGDDEASMSANNTSSFNCRTVTALPGVFSQHSYGRAIDINPLINPYVEGKEVLPKQGRAYLDRNQYTDAPGKITKNSLIYKLFIHYGWDWGGHWYDVQDYHHFEKRANGQRRNPYGYQKKIHV